MDCSPPTILMKNCENCAKVILRLMRAAIRGMYSAYQVFPEFADDNVEIDSRLGVRVPYLVYNRVP